MCRVADGDDALEIPLREDMFLQRHHDRRDPLVQELLEFQRRSDVVIFSLCEQRLLVSFGVSRNIIAIDSLRELEEIEPVDTTFGTTVDDIRVMLSEYRIRRAWLNALAWLGNSEDAAGVTRDGWNESGRVSFIWILGLTGMLVRRDPSGRHLVRDPPHFSPYDAMNSISPN